MQTCEDHDDAVVVFNGKWCPLCCSIKMYDDTREDLNDIISSQAKEIDRLSNLVDTIKENSPQQYVIATLQQGDPQP